MKYFRRLTGAALSGLRGGRAKILFAVLKLLVVFFSVIPRQIGFALVVLSNALGLPGRNGLQRAFTPVTIAKLTLHPGFRFSSVFTRLFQKTEISTLHGIGAHTEVVEVVEARGAHATSRPIAALMARSLFELGDFARARSVLDMVYAPAQMSLQAPVAHFKALLDLIDGDILTAIANLQSAGRGMPQILRPHHNLAARYRFDYQPNPMDALAGDFGRLYDAANYAGQRVTHVGRGELGGKIYKIALDAQKKLVNDVPPPLSAKLVELLDKLDISFDELRIIPEEWSTQVGHLGMLDMLFRMRQLGWWSGKAIIVTRPDLVANYAFQRLFQDEARLLVMGKDIDDAMTAELASLQRWKGMSFNAFELPDGSVAPWQNAGALMMRQWEKEGRGFPVRERYEQILGLSETLTRAVANIKARWGMKPGEWYVCLHMRDAAHYGELAGTGQTHRNAAVGAYIQAIKHVTDQGGWVIKLGGPHSPKLPKMPRVFDYARSKDRSDVMDLHLIRNARYFIGTTSGLTNVAVSFGVPAALVNCITTDAQLWSNRVRFATKWIRLRNGMLIDQLQLTSTPWRWRVFSAELLGRYDGLLIDNSADEILETVKEVEALAAGRTAEYLKAIPDAESVIARWRDSLDFPHFYGDALPGLYAVRKFTNFLKPQRRSPEIDPAPITPMLDTVATATASTSAVDRTAEELHVALQVRAAE